MFSLRPGPSRLSWKVSIFCGTAKIVWICMTTSKQWSTSWCFKPTHHINGILPKRPYTPCLRMADRALLAGYPWHPYIDKSGKVAHERQTDGCMKPRQYPSVLVVAEGKKIYSIFIESWCEVHMLHVKLHHQDFLIFVPTNCQPL